MASKGKKDFITGNGLSLKVWIDGAALPIKISQRVKYYAESFAWGYRGPGQSQLAIALLLAFGATEKETLAWHEEFRDQIIATQATIDLEIPIAIVRDWIDIRKIFAKNIDDIEKH